MITSRQNSHPKFRFIATGAVATLALTACSSGSQAFVNESRLKAISAGNIPAGTHFRTSPRVIEDGATGENNLCATADHDITFDSTTVYENAGDANGEFVGFSNGLPETIEKSCGDTVWVALSQINASIFSTVVESTPQS